MADIYSVSEAAEKLGLDPSQVRRLLKKGIIEGKKLGHDWVVLSLDYKKKKFGVGRKPKVVVEPVLSKTDNQYIRLKYL
ncbi:helix-turn-helix domain-containing protein [Chloroflexota bacterium]